MYYLGIQLIETVFPQFARLNGVGHYFQKRPFNTRCRDISFQTPLPSASAITVRRAWSDSRVTNLACKSIVAINQLSVNHKSAAQACTQGYYDKVFHSPGTAINHLAYSSCIGVVCYNNG